MNLDNHGIEAAYVVLVTASWLWALSQLRVAIMRPTGWRWSVTLWLTTKAIFLTTAGVIWWANVTNPIYLEVAIYLWVLGHIVAVTHWLRLSDRDDALTRLPVEGEP